MNEWSLVFYETANGRRPVEEYLDSLSGEEAAKVRFDLDLLKSYGLLLGAPYVRSIGGKLWELRTRGQAQHRVFYFAASGKLLVLLHAFTKKARKTPTREIEIARRRMEDYQRRVSR